MKKLAKVLALSLVLCMALSTAAFAAASGDATGNAATKTVNVTVTDVATDQVALLIVASDVASLASVTQSQIYYIDQKAAASGTATFAAPIAANVDKVDVYVGSSTIAAANNAALKVGDDISIADEMKITFTAGNAKILGASDFTEGEEVRPGAAIKVNLSNVSKIKKMIWALKGEKTNDSKLFTNAIDLETAVTGVDGDVVFTAIFPVAETEASIGTISSVDAIFLAVDDAGTEKTFYTDADDASKQAE